MNSYIIFKLHVLYLFSKSSRFWIVVPLGLGVCLKDGEHNVTDKESSPSLDKKCPNVGTVDICISHLSQYVFETSAPIFSDLF